ncbi:hypothetical protein QJS66_15465 [Kocuria rhizophila]|nr:hypothetical protein QJS66_15465 [Kocuria rhizophila]
MSLAARERRAPEHEESDAWKLARAGGTTTILVAVDGRLWIRRPAGHREGDEAPAVIAELKGAGPRPVLLTGDNAAVARSVAEQVGIDPADVIADTTRTARSRPSRSCAPRATWWPWWATASTTPGRPPPTSGSPWAPARTPPCRPRILPWCAASSPPFRWPSGSSA